MTLSLHKVSDTYFDRLFVAKNNTALTSGIKARVLLVDKHTTPIISMCYTQSQLLQHDVILVELIENQHNLSLMKHLNCVVYIKPTRESVLFLQNELRQPHFNNYQLFFNNTVTKSQLEKVAESDEFEVIGQVVEIFQDYLIFNDNLFGINLSNISELVSNNKSNAVAEEANSIASMLLSLGKCPVIKYESSSLELRKLSSEILYNINSNSNNNLFDDLNKKSDVPPVLVLLDRKSDPITPLLTPWTYQSMLHELIGVSKNIVHLGEEQVLLSETHDRFFKELMYLNYGDLTDKFQRYVEDYKKQTKLSLIENLKTQNLAELKKLLTRFPEFKKLSNNILKHLNLITELDKQIASQNLWEVGELQQTIICNLESHQHIRQRLTEVLGLPVLTSHKVKLVLLYTLKFPEADTTGLVGRLTDSTVTNPPPTTSQLNLIKSFNKLFGGKNIKQTDNNSNNIGNIFNKNKISINLLFLNNTKAAPKSDNIYMQYIPKLNETLNNLINPPPGQPSELSTLTPDTVSAQYGSSNNHVQDIIVYIKGGVTYEESRLIHELAATNPTVHLLIGGDKVINSNQWLDVLYDTVNEPEPDFDRHDRHAQLRDIL